MVSAWRADDSSRGCGSGGERLEMKRRHRVQLEGNNDGGKDRKEDGGKGGAMTLSPLEAQGKDSGSRLCDCSRGLDMTGPGKGRRGVRAGDDSRGYGRGMCSWDRWATIRLE
ncbi:hypothetical protein B296_00020132 [Ensete ventricosum]|uniref:Uncharacterized protein n=1 Tax=Ensete ventricosum TaxID=4639 RepID=A0A426ZJ20_ENSVE|nr:hypothetical protein B296_00020132 [Ensete ventricosum]